MAESDNPQPAKRGPGRPKVTDKEPHSTIVIRLPTTLLDRAKALADGTVAAFVREAITRELRRREKAR